LRRFQHVRVFPYSRKRNAGTVPGRVPKKTAKKRYEMIMSLQEKISHAHNRGLIGGAADVLVEGAYGQDGTSLKGRFYGQAPEVDGMVVVSGAAAAPGEFVTVRFTDAYP
jgi:ribosomal protein S12 methylthiotransferase